MRRALIFDFDGLIADTEWAIYVAWSELYESEGHTLPLETYVQCVGSTFAAYDPMAALEALTGRPVDWSRLLRQKDRRIRELHADLVALPGVPELLRDAAASGVPCALASSSETTWVEPWLERLGLRAHFPVVRCRNHVPSPKPAPDLFLAAAEGLGLPPHECLVLEDSRNGLLAALAAGTPCVIIPNRITRTSDFSGSRRILPTLAGVSTHDLLAL